MKLIWKVDNEDICKVKNFVNENRNPLVEKVIERNVDKKQPFPEKDMFLKSIIMCLLTSQQPSGPNSKVGLFIQKTSFPITYLSVKEQSDISGFIKVLLMDNGLNRFINKIPNFFEKNFQFLEDSNWGLYYEIKEKLSGNPSKESERKMADKVDVFFKGFGSKQSRNFLQSLGLTRYEVPLDSRIIKWLRDFGFPIELSSSALQDKYYYHFILDGFQELCEKAELFPCVVDAAIFSSFDNGQWTKENAIY